MATITNIYPVSIEGGEFTIDGQIVPALRFVDKDGNVTNVLLAPKAYQELGQMLRAMFDQDFGPQPH